MVDKKDRSGEPMRVTLRNLHKTTSDIIKEMNDQNRPVIVSRHGRFLALITPLANIENLEGSLLGKMLAREPSNTANSDVSTVTLEKLHTSTSEIIRQVNDQDQATVVTRMGRIIALIRPLATIENLEGSLLGRMLTEAINGEPDESNPCPLPFCAANHLAPPKEAPSV